MSGTKFDLEDEDLVRKITKAFNCSLKFDPAEQRMAYVVRDPVVNGKYTAAMNSVKNYYHSYSEPMLQAFWSSI